MNEMLNNAKKVLECVIVDKAGRAISDEHVSYMCAESVKVGDVFAVYFRGKYAFAEVVTVHPMWSYSQERIGLGTPDTMSWVVQKIDFEKHAQEKKARKLARDIKAAFDERMAKAREDAERDAFIAKLPEAEQAKFKELLAVQDAIIANPEKIDELVKDLN